VKGVAACRRPEGIPFTRGLLGGQGNVKVLESKVDVPKAKAEMRLIPQAGYQAAVVAFVDLLKQQSCVQQLLAALATCFILARDREMER